MCETLSWFQAIQDVNVFLEFDFASKLCFYDYHANNVIFSRIKISVKWNGEQTNIKLLFQSEASF